MTHTERTVLAVIHATFGSERAGGVDLDSRLLDAGLLDSLALVSLVTGLDEALGIVIATEDLTIDNFNTGRDIARLVGRYRDARAGGSGGPEGEPSPPR